MLPDLGSVAKPTRVANHPLTQAATLEVSKYYWHIFDQMEDQPRQGQTLTLEYPIVDQVANAPMKAIPL